MTQINSGALFHFRINICVHGMSMAFRKAQNPQMAYKMPLNCDAQSETMRRFDIKLELIWV